MLRLSRSLVISAAAGVAALTALTGCSSSSEGVSDHKAGSSAAAEWGDCMRDRGVQVEDPTADEVASGVYKQPSGVDSAAFSDAAAACQPKDAPVDDKHRATDENIAKWKREGSAFISCMAEHGVTGFTGPNEAGSVSYENVDQETPAFTEWQPKCAKKHMPDNESLGY